MIDVIEVRVIDGPCAGEVYDAPAGSQFLTVHRLRPWLAGGVEVLDHIIRPAPSAFSELWVGVLDWPVVMAARLCSQCRRHVPRDRLLTHGCIDICDICCWDSTSWARSDRRVG